VTLAPEQPQAQIIDLFEALKQSLAETTGGAANAEPPAPKTTKAQTAAKGPKKARAKKEDSEAKPKPLKKAPANKRSGRGKVANE
jgi:peptidoglycan hydrolase CwlO-like protein